MIGIRCVHSSAFEVSYKNALYKFTVIIVAWQNVPLRNC